MHALIISHAAVIPTNQILYVEMERLEGVELTLVVPRRWKASMGGDTQFERHPELQSEALERDVRLSGQINLHTYKGLHPSHLDRKPDVLYADEDPYSAAAYQALRMARHLGVPFVFKSNQNLPKSFPPPFSVTERAVMAGAQAAIAIAPACKEVLRAKGCECHIEVIGHGIDPEIFEPRCTADMREELGLSGFVVGFMGRLSEEKGVADLVEACGKLAADGHRDFSLLLVGDGPLRPKLEARTQKLLERVPAKFPGSVRHGRAGEYLSCLDALVLPSRSQPNWQEQFGRVIVEAMACGVPVVGSDSGNIPVLIGETGGGRVFPEGDVEALAEVLGELLADPQGAKELGRRGHEYVLRNYSNARIAERIAGVLRNAAES